MLTILKIPFEGGIVEKDKLGTKEAPAQIQRYLKLKLKSRWVDVKISPDLLQTYMNIFKAADSAYKKKNFVIGLGGDHSITYSLAKAFARNFKGEKGLLYFDAHPDCWSGFLPPDHESVVRGIIAENLIPAKDILILGVRKITKEEEKFIERKGISWIPTRKLLKSKAQIQHFCSRLQNIYLSIDLDVLSPKLAPGVTWPEPGGLPPSELMLLIKRLARSGKVKGIDIVEVCPKRDLGGITSRLAAKLLISFVAKAKYI